jgi:hypothetical protein
MENHSIFEHGTKDDGLPLPELPAEFGERLARVVPASQLQDVLSTFHTVKPVTFRSNPLKTSTSQLRAELEQSGFSPQPHSWYGEAFALAPGGKARPDRNGRLLRGRLYIQNLASMLAPLSLDPNPAKRSLISPLRREAKLPRSLALMGNQGRLSVVEAIKPRFFRLKANLEQQGVAIARAFLMDGRLVGRKCPQMFDRILLDAPCSSEARFSRLDPQSWTHWSLRKVKETAAQAKRPHRRRLGGTQTRRDSGLLHLLLFTGREREDRGITYCAEMRMPVIMPWQPAITNRATGSHRLAGQGIAPPAGGHFAGASGWHDGRVLSGQDLQSGPPERTLLHEIKFTPRPHQQRPARQAKPRARPLWSR